MSTAASLQIVRAMRHCRRAEGQIAPGTRSFPGGASPAVEVVDVIPWDRVSPGTPGRATSSSEDVAQLGLEIPVAELVAEALEVGRGDPLIGLRDLAGPLGAEQ